jgi:hypothetical protein
LDETVRYDPILRRGNFQKNFFLRAIRRFDVLFPICIARPVDSDGT